MAEIEKQASPNVEHHEEARISKRKHPVGKKEQDPPILTVDELAPKDPVHDKVVKDKEHHKIQELIKHPPSEPHPLDRKSGTGRGTEMRKNGAGKNNWGTYQDDIKFDEEEVFTGELNEYTEVQQQKREKSPQNLSPRQPIQTEQPVIFEEKEFPKLQ